MCGGASTMTDNPVLSPMASLPYSTVLSLRTRALSDIKTLPDKKKIHFFIMESGLTSVNLIDKYGTDKLDQVIVYTQKELTCFVKDHAFNSHISVKVKSQRKTVIYNCTSCDWKVVYTHEIPSKSRSKEQCKYYYSKT